MYTPAPWTIENRPTGGFDIDASFEDQRERVAFAINPSNARLIAAAPDLLLHLQRLVRAIDRAPANFADGLADEARAAIARATGANA